MIHITDTTKLMAASIAGAIIAAEKDNATKREFRTDYMEGADWREDERGDFVMRETGDMWWSGYDPEEPGSLPPTWKRITVLVPWEQRVARYALRIAQGIDKQAKLIEDGPIPD